MRGKSTKWAAANPPRISASPGTIRKYMVQEGGKESPGKQTGTKSKTPEGISKTGLRKQLVEIDTPIASSKILEEEVTMEPKQKKQLPTKDEMAEMFARVETFIKGEIATLHEDMNHMLKRVEEAETLQGDEIKRLKDQMDEMQKEQRNLLYKIEYQENRNRRKNLQIRSLPEIQGEKEELQEKNR